MNNRSEMIAAQIAIEAELHLMMYIGRDNSIRVWRGDQAKPIFLNSV